jgi:uncharacterized NAD(P)/FAD-binding protein YdhS
MPSESRRRFLEHARPWWDTHRHRMAPEIATKIGALIECGQLRILSGRVLKVNPKPGGASVSIRPRASAAAFALEVSRIVSCRGADERSAAEPPSSVNPARRSRSRGANLRCCANLCAGPAGC